MSIDVEVYVRAAIAEAGLPASEEEIAAWIASYPALRSALASLYAVEEAREEVPAVMFDAAPPLADWRAKADAP